MNPFRRAHDTQVTVGHYSLKHSLDPDVIGQYIADAVKADNLDAFTTTESSRAYLEAVRDELEPEWRVGGAGEYMIGCRVAVVRPTRTARKARLSHVYKDSAAWRDLWVASRPVVIRKARRTWTIEAGHLAASVQKGQDWRVENSLAVSANKVGSSAWGKRIRRGRRVRPWILRSAHFDGNLDQHEEVWREYFEHELRLPSMWRGPRRPAGGSHGKRLIDSMHFDPRFGVRRSRLSRAPKPDAIDHVGVVADLLVPARKFRLKEIR